MINEWDKFNQTKSLCRQLGCKQWNIDICCPEMMGKLCQGKIQLLKKLEIEEKDLDNNIVTFEEVVKQMQKNGEGTLK